MRESAEDLDVLPIELDPATRARFVGYCRSIGRGDEVGRVAAEVFRDLIWDDEFARANPGPTAARLYS